MIITWISSNNIDLHTINTYWDFMMHLVFSVSWWPCLYIYLTCSWRRSEWVWACKWEVDSCSHGNRNLKNTSVSSKSYVFKLVLLLVGGNNSAEHNINAIKPKWWVTCKYWCSCKWIYVEFLCSFCHGNSQFSLTGRWIICKHRNVIYFKAIGIF